MGWELASLVERGSREIFFTPKLLILNLESWAATNWSFKKLDVNRERIWDWDLLVASSVPQIQMKLNQLFIMYSNVGPYQKGFREELCFYRLLVTAPICPPKWPISAINILKYFSQNWSSVGYIEGLTGSVPQLVQMLWHKTQVYFSWLGYTQEMINEHFLTRF